MADSDTAADATPPSQASATDSGRPAPGGATATPATQEGREAAEDEGEEA